MFRLAVNIFNQNDPAKSVQGLNNGLLEKNIAGIINLILFAGGLLAIIFIIIAGFKYVLSQGNDQAVTSAKNTFMYALVGLIITILAYAIVHWLTTTRF